MRIPYFQEAKKGGEVRVNRIIYYIGLEHVQVNVFKQLAPSCLTLSVLSGREEEGDGLV